MDLNRALEKAAQILDEERVCPTVEYKLKVKGVADIADLLTAMVVPQRLLFLRSQRPRPVEEMPQSWGMESANYALLCALHSQVLDGSRSDFMRRIVRRIASPPGCGRTRRREFPNWDGLSSELPLIAEFCLRNGAKQEFFGVLSEAAPIPGHAVLLRHLEEIVSLNFMIIGDSEYGALASAVINLKEKMKQKLDNLRASNVREEVWPNLGALNSFTYGVEIMAAVDSIKEQCRKAKYFYLESSLVEGFNLEVNQDKEAVKGYLQLFGFSRALAEFLNEADQLYRQSATPFDLKGSMGHLRSFLERLHAEAMPALQIRMGGVASQKWGEGLKYLRDQEVITQSEEQFSASLYTLISDEGVHPIIAEREYARLARYMVIEYALLFLGKLEKLGLKTATSAP